MLLSQVELTGPHLSWVSTTKIPLVVESEHPTHQFPASIFCATVVLLVPDLRSCIRQIKSCSFRSWTPLDRQNPGIKRISGIEPTWRTILDRPGRFVLRMSIFL